MKQARTLPKQIFRWLWIPLTVILALALLFLVVKLLLINGKRKAVSGACAISQVREYDLGGHKQKAMIEGRAKDLPIVVYLHGGPGTPMPFNVGSRGMVPEITDRNIFVTWDQYGSGINNAKLDQSLSVDDVVQMAKDLVLALKRDFPDNRLTLFGVSWGSMLATRLADEIPELIDEVVVYGQISKDLFMNDEVFTALQAAKLSKKDREALQAIMAKESYADADVEKVARWLMRYTEAYFAKGSGVMDYMDLVLGAFISPDYRFADAKALFKNGYGKDTEHLVHDLVAMDLTPILDRITVPYTILQGEKDLVTSTQAIRQYFEKTKNPNLRFEVIPDSAHMPSKKALAYILDFDQFRQVPTK